MKRNRKPLVALHSSEEVARQLGVAVKTLAAWRSNEVGPPYIRLGRTIRYRSEDIEAYIGESVRGPALFTLRSPSKSKTGRTRRKKDKLGRTKPETADRAERRRAKHRKRSKRRDD